jgi:hypothetical protein
MNLYRIRIIGSLQAPTETVHAQGIGPWETLCGIKILDADPTIEKVTCRRCISSQKKQIKAISSGKVKVR